MLKDLWISNTILLIVATFFSGVLSGYFFSPDNFLVFLPPVLWSLALCVTTKNSLADKWYDCLAMAPFSVILWMIVTFLAAFCTRGLQSGPFSAFSIVGGIGAMCSYWLFARVVLNNFDYKYLLLCFALGYISITLCQLLVADSSVFIQKRNLFVCWQTLAGVGHGLAYYKTVIITGNNKKQLT